MKSGVKALFSATLLALLFACLPQAHALAPEDGVWWNPSQSGRGWFIVSQNNTMVVASYTFAQDGSPQWYISTGTYSPSTRTLNASLLGFRNGQCIGCAYRAPEQTTSPGSLRIEFEGDERATLTQAGETVQLQKFMFGYPQRDDRLWGEWAFAMNVVGLGDSEFLVFDRPFTGSNGTQYVQMRRRYSSAGLGLASFEQSRGEYLALLDSSTSYYKLFVYPAGANRSLGGRYWLYLKTASPTGSGNPMVAMRVRDRADVPTPLSGPAAQDKSLAADVRDAELAKAMEVQGEAPAYIQQWAAKLAAEMENAKRAQAN
jgi:hypothetical protein